MISFWAFFSAYPIPPLLMAFVGRGGGGMGSLLFRTAIVVEPATDVLGWPAS